MTRAILSALAEGLSISSFIAAYLLVMLLTTGHLENAHAVEGGSQLAWQDRSRR
jgi:hypothetical protein